MQTNTTGAFAYYGGSFMDVITKQGQILGNGWNGFSLGQSGMIFIDFKSILNQVNSDLIPFLANFNMSG